MSVANLSKSRLERMHRVLAGYVERQETVWIYLTTRKRAHGGPSRCSNRVEAGSSPR
jgi:hypothetical protein